MGRYKCSASDRSDPHDVRSFPHSNVERLKPTVDNFAKRNEKERFKRAGRCYSASAQSLLPFRSRTFFGHKSRSWGFLCARPEIPPRFGSVSVPKELRSGGERGELLLLRQSE